MIVDLRGVETSITLINTEQDDIKREIEQLKFSSHFCETPDIYCTKSSILIFLADDKLVASKIRANKHPISLRTVDEIHRLVTDDKYDIYCTDKALSKMEHVAPTLKMYVKMLRKKIIEK